MIDISGENVVLVGALLLFVAVMAGKVAYRFGAPALLLFLGVGMLFGLNFISYRSVEMTQFVGMIALCIILFTGGMDTKFSEIKPIAARPGTRECPGAHGGPLPYARQQFCSHAGVRVRRPGVQAADQAEHSR